MCFNAHISCLHNTTGNCNESTKTIATSTLLITVFYISVCMMVFLSAHYNEYVLCMDVCVDVWKCVVCDCIGKAW